MAASKKAQLLRSWCHDIDSNMSEFHRGSDLIVRNHQKTNEKTKSFAIVLKDMAQHEYCEIIKNALEDLSQALTETEEHRLAIAAELQYHLCDQFSKYPSKLKLQDFNIRERNKSYSQFVKKQSDWLKTRSSTTNINKINLARDVLESEKKRLQSAEETLNTSVGQFEEERVTDMKLFLRKYIQCSLYLCFRQIESLSRAYKKVCMIDPIVEKERWINEMKQIEKEEQAEDTLMATTR